MFLTDMFHGVTHKCSDEFKYHAHLLKEGREFQGPRVTGPQEVINGVMKRFDSTQAASTITNGMLVYDYFSYRHNMAMRTKWLEIIRAQGGLPIV
jgi:hypothetical protein